MNGVAELIKETTKYGEQTYTSWEVYKDFLVFLCSVGCRYSDGIKIKVGDFINTKNIPGIEELKIDVNKSKPSLEIEVDRQKAGELGINPSQIGLVLRRSLFGEKAFGAKITTLSTTNNWIEASTMHPLISVTVT